jgi:cytochrome o ubiquinol oxidase subunit 1
MKPQASDYTDIAVPRNSSVGLIIGVLAGLTGFGLIWHMWWLAVLAGLAIIGTVIIRTLRDDNEMIITAETLRREAKGAWL